MGTAWVNLGCTWKGFLCPPKQYFFKKSYIRALAEEGYTGLAALCAERKLRYYKIRPKEPCV